MNVAGVELRDPRPVAGGDICRAWRATTSDGTEVFAKTLAGAPHGLFAAEARGLARLVAPGGPPVPQPLAVSDDGLVLPWVAPGTANADAAAELGRALAAMHAASPGAFGSDQGGFIGPLPLPAGGGEAWPHFYAEYRLAPYLGALDDDARRLVEAVIERLPDLAGPDEAPALVHGDLWSGNVLWAAGGPAWLVDAASVHGGHRETDLAMLALFGCPHLDVLMSSYEQVTPLAPGWRDRLPLHQLHPLLVHATLFGGGYGRQVAVAASTLLGGGGSRRSSSTAG